MLLKYICKMKGVVIRLNITYTKQQNLLYRTSCSQDKQSIITHTVFFLHPILISQSLKVANEFKL